MVWGGEGIESEKGGGGGLGVEGIGGGEMAGMKGEDLGGLEEGRGKGEGGLLTMYTNGLVKEAECMSF